MSVLSASQIENDKKSQLDPNPVWDLFVEKLAPSHRKRAKISADLPLFPIGCTTERAGWYKYQYAIPFTAVPVVAALSTLLWAVLILYFTFVGEHELFSKAVFAAVHSENDGKMALFLMHNPKYLTPFMLGLANVYAAYFYAMVLPPGVKWYHIVWRREACKKLSVEYATNLLEAVDAAESNMRTWYTQVLVSAFFCALLVSPRIAGVCLAIFSLSRLFTPVGMFLENPIPQTILMSFGTALTFRFMLFVSIQMITRDVLPDWLVTVNMAFLNLDTALAI